MKFFDYLQFKDGSYAIGELSADGNRTDGLVYEYWSKDNTMGIGEFHNGSLNGICILEKEDNAFHIGKYKDSNLDDNTIFLRRGKTLDICPFQDGKFYGHNFEIFKNGWRYYFYDENNSTSRMIEYDNEGHTLGMYYAKPGGECEWYHAIGQKLIKWDASIPLISFKNEVYPNCEFTSGNNCINPVGDEGPCIDYIPKDCETIIGTINSDGKYEGIVYTDSKKYVTVEQRSNGYNTGIYYRLKKDMSYWEYTWFNTDNSSGNAKVFAWPKEGWIEIRYYNYEGSEDYDVICIDKDFNVTIMVRYDTAAGSKKIKDGEEYNYDDLYNADMEEDNNQEAEEQDEEEVEEEEVEEAPKKQLKIKPKSKKASGGAKKKSTSADDWDSFFKVLGKKK